MDLSKDKLRQKINTVFDPEAIRKNQRLVIFTICLIIASILWILNALSKNYTTEIIYPVRYVNLPKNKFIINDPPQRLQLRVNAHGFTLLRYKLRLTFSPVNLDISNIISDYHLSSGSNLNIQSTAITNNIAGQVGSDLQIIDTRPPILTLVFDSLKSRIVPVAARFNASYLSRFDQSANAVVSPSHVELTGPRTVVNGIDSLHTVSRSFKNVKSSIQRDFQIEVPEKTTVMPRKVTVRVPVDEFTQKNFQVPISIKSLPQDVKVRLFPQQVDVSFSIGLKQFSEITNESFKIYVDWEDIQSGKTTLPLKTESAPPGLKSLKISPSHVEYLIEKE